MQFVSIYNRNMKNRVENKMGAWLQWGVIVIGLGYFLVRFGLSVFFGV